MITIILSVLIVVLDRLTKNIIAGSMTLGESDTIIDGILDITYIHNDGAAFSMFKGQQTALICFTIVVMIAILAYMIIYKKSISALEKFSLILIIGGGIGNLIDRVMCGYVVDFINIHIIPVFNVADIAITCGCLLFAISVFVPHKK